MINIQETSQITKIYLVTNCYGDPNKVYIGKTINSRKYDHIKTYGKYIIYTEIDEIKSLDHKKWSRLETFWIEYFKFLGFDIQNPRKCGGNGPSFQTKEAKEKISINNKGKCSKPIIQYSLDGNFIKEWSNARDASNILGININSISSCCNNKKIKKTGGYIFKFKSNPLPSNYKMPYNKTSSKQIIQKDLKNNFIKEWNSCSEAGRYYNISPSRISSCCRGLTNKTLNYKWSFK